MYSVVIESMFFANDLIEISDISYVRSIELKSVIQAAQRKISIRNINIYIVDFMKA